LDKIFPSTTIDAAVSSQEDSIANIVMGLLNRTQRYYFVLIASTGFIFAAIDAGMIPDITPKMIQILKAKTTILGAICKGKGRTEPSATVSIHTKNNPTKPPMIHKKALSNKNSYKMVELFAPMAFFKPI
jgi:hypothetical protein